MENDTMLLSFFSSPLVEQSRSQFNCCSPLYLDPNPSGAAGSCGAGDLKRSTPVR
jgi:hypothetical protein